MRVQELYEQVSGLGFEKALEDDDIFYQAANRALLQVNSIRPAVSSYTINHRPMKNLLPESFECIERITDITFEAIGAKSYYFECDGIGTCFIEKKTAGGGWTQIGDIEFSSIGRFVSYSGFIKEGRSFVEGSVRLRFTGQYIYSVKNVALYEHAYSDKVEDIPAFEAYTKYDMAELVDDFIRLASPPVLEDGEGRRLYRDYDMEGRRFLLIPRKNTGVFKVVYERKPEALVNDGSAVDDDTVIDLDEELCALLPLNIAAYVWADDEPEKAELYLTLYRERRAEIIAKDEDLRPVRYITNGW